MHISFGNGASKWGKESSAAVVNPVNIVMIMAEYHPSMGGWTWILVDGDVVLSKAERPFHFISPSPLFCFALNE
jgi:hypothetical protein